MTVEEKKAKVEKIKRDYELFMSLYPFNPQSLIDEIWAVIEGYEEHYQISNYGRVKSFYRGKEHILKPEQNGNGYLNVALVSDKKRKHFYIHILVANAFIPNPDNLPEVNHEDGIKFNCHVSNLTRTTHSGNNKHAYKNGLRTPKTGENNGKSKLTNKDVRWIREHYIPRDKEFGGKALAKKFGVRQDTISDIIHGNTYKDA